MAEYVAIGKIDLDKWEIVIPDGVRAEHAKHLKWAKKHLSPAYWYPYTQYGIEDVMFKPKAPHAG